MISIYENVNYIYDTKNDNTEFNTNTVNITYM